jgi:hypothetical protein
MTGCLGNKEWTCKFIAAARSQKDLKIGGLLVKGPLGCFRNHEERGDWATKTEEAGIGPFPFELRVVKQFASTCPEP